MKALPTILIVEDMDDDVFFLKRALLRAGIVNPLQVAVDGQQALNYLSGTGVHADRTAHPLPFLILLDMKLPYVMGLDVLKWIRRHPELNATAVAVLSSSQQENDVNDVLAEGGDAYLVKPATPEKLTRLMEAIREGRKAVVDL